MYYDESQCSIYTTTYSYFSPFQTKSEEISKQKEFLYSSSILFFFKSVIKSVSVNYLISHQLR